MKKIFLFCAFFLICQTSKADIILLKNGQTIEGEVTQVRGIFIRVKPEYGQPFREFLIENVAHIEQTDPSKASHLAIKNIHDRAISIAQDQNLQEAAKKRAAVLVEEAIQNSQDMSLNGAPEGVKTVAQEKASAIIGEAVKRTETPELIDTSNEIRTIAQEKASGIIEQAVKEVEVIPLQKAPESIRPVVEKVASTMKWRPLASRLELTTKESIIAGLLVLVLFMLLIEKIKSRRKIPETKKDKVLSSKLKEIDKELEEFDKNLTQTPKKPVRSNDEWIERRQYARARKDFPISLILDKVKPISGVVKNISLGGAYCLCNDIKLFKLGDRCRFKFYLNDDLDSGVEGKAEVIRTRLNRGLALRFSELDKNSTNLLMKI